MTLVLEVVYQIAQICLVPLVYYLTGQIVAWLETKRNDSMQQIKNETEQKYMMLLRTTIADCVIATNQTYVNALKEKGAFTPEAQQIAFNKTLKAIKAVLNEEAQTYLSEMYNDLDSYIKTQIEATVNVHK